MRETEPVGDTGGGTGLVLAEIYDAVAQATGVPPVVIDSDELGARVASPTYVGAAWWEPNMGLVNQVL
mgnify:CR=1 FL=1